MQKSRNQCQRQINAKNLIFKNNNDNNVQGDCYKASDNIQNGLPSTGIEVHW